MTAQERSRAKAEADAYFMSPDIFSQIGNGRKFDTEEYTQLETSEQLGHYETDEELGYYDGQLASTSTLKLRENV